MRISDWSSDVCTSDLVGLALESSCLPEQRQLFSLPASRLSGSSTKPGYLIELRLIPLKSSQVFHGSVFVGQDGAEANGKRLLAQGDVIMLPRRLWGTLKPAPLNADRIRHGMQFDQRVRPEVAHTQDRTSAVSGKSGY